MSELMQELNSFTGWLLIASLKSLPLIATLLLVQYGLKTYLSASARHSLWLCLFLCLSIPIGWNLPFDNRPAELLFSPPENDITSASTPEIITSPTAATLSTPANTEKVIHQATDAVIHTINYHSILSLIWMSIFSGFIFITLWQLLRFKRVLRKASDATTQDYLLLQNARHTLGMSQTIPLLYSSEISNPLTLGLFKPTIILPVDIEQRLTEKQLSLVLLHELAHIQRRDILWNWLAYGITLMHWFNPLIWLASKRMKGDMEMACDAKVLSYLSPQDRNDYGLTLINLSQLSSKPLGFAHSLGILENHRELKDRLIMIKEFTAMTLKKSLVFGLVFSAFAFAALAQPTSGSKPTEGTLPPYATASMALSEFAQRAEKDLKIQVLVGRDHANANIPVNLTDKPLSYGQLLSQLKINGFTAYKSSGYIQIIPISEARSYAIPVVEKGKTYADDEYVTDSIHLQKACAGNVLATVRPLVPRDGHLTTLETANTLIITDFYQNIVRVKATIKSLEDNIKEPTPCPAFKVAQKIKPTTTEKK